MTHRGTNLKQKQNLNQKCIYSILTKSVYKVTMKRFRIRGPLGPINTSLVANIRAAYNIINLFSYYKLKYTIKLFSAKTDV